MYENRNSHGAPQLLHGNFDLITNMTEGVILMDIRSFDEWVNNLIDEEKGTILMYRIGDDKHGIPLKDFIKTASRFIIPKAY